MSYVSVFQSAHQMEFENRKKKEKEKKTHLTEPPVVKLLSSATPKESKRKGFLIEQNVI